MAGREAWREGPEAWRVVPGFGGQFAVSTHGRIRREKVVSGSLGAGRILAGSATRHGARYMKMVQGGAERIVPLRDMVALAFLGPIPEHSKVVHLDGDVGNHAPWNLAFTDPSRRTCAKCGKAKPATTEHFHWTVRTGSRQSRFASYCKVCLRRTRPSFETRFWDRVVKGEGCWSWTGSTIRGYGRLWRNGKNEQAHRISYELHHGPIPDGLLVRHKCDNRICSNPDHLELGTHADNQRDKAVRGRSLKGEEHVNAVLTDAKVREIRRLHRQGVNRRQLSRMFGTDYSNVCLIVNRKTWRHIP